MSSNNAPYRPDPYGVHAPGDRLPPSFTYKGRGEDTRMEGRGETRVINVRIGREKETFPLHSKFATARSICSTRTFVEAVMVFCIQNVARGLLSRRKTQASQPPHCTSTTGSKYADYSELGNHPPIGRPLPLQSHRRALGVQEQRTLFHVCENDGCPDVRARPISHFVDSWVGPSAVSYLEDPDAKDLNTSASRDTLYPRDSYSGVEKASTPHLPPPPIVPPQVLMFDARHPNIEGGDPFTPAEISGWERVVVERCWLLRSDQPRQMVICPPDRHTTPHATLPPALGKANGGLPLTPLSSNDRLQDANPEPVYFNDEFSGLSYATPADHPNVPTDHTPVSPLSLNALSGKPLPALPSAPNPTQGDGTGEGTNAWSPPLIPPASLDTERHSPLIVIHVNRQDESDHAIFVRQSLIDELAETGAVSRRHASIISVEAYYPSPEATPDLRGYVEFNAAVPPSASSVSNTEDTRASSEAPSITTPIPRVSTSFSSLYLSEDDTMPKEVKRWGMTGGADGLGDWVVDDDVPSIPSCQDAGELVPRTDLGKTRPMGLGITFGDTSTHPRSRWSPGSSAAMEHISPPVGEGVLLPPDMSGSSLTPSNSVRRGMETESADFEPIGGDEALEEALAILDIEPDSFGADGETVRSVTRILQELLLMRRAVAQLA